MRKILPKVVVLLQLMELCPTFVEQIRDLFPHKARQRYLYLNMKFIFFFILTALAFFHCSTPAPHTKRSLDVYVRYLSDTKQVRAEATYKEGSPELQAVAPKNGMKYQNLDMSIKPYQGLTFQKTGTMDFLNKQQFSWMDHAGKEHLFQMKMEPIDVFSFEYEPLSIKKPVLFSWQGEGLQRGEVLVFLWERIADGETVKMEIYQDITDPEIKFTASKIAELKPGKWKLYLVRKKMVKETIDGVDATGILEYYSKTDTLEVKG
jgi:hypothetical protein